MAFRLSKRSQARLLGVHPALRQIVERAIVLTQFDFGVTSGVRSVAEQAKLVSSGRSQTMRSRHITGHAVDVVAIQSGAAIWDWPPYNMIADAFKAAADESDVIIRWGGAWSVNDFTNYDGSAEDAMSDYVALRRSQGRRPFLDGPHFELPRAIWGDDNPAAGERSA